MSKNTLRAEFPRILGVLLLIAAAALYIRTNRTRAALAESESSASVIRSLAAQAAAEREASLTNGVPAKVVAVAHTIEGMDLPPILYPCPDDVATNLLATLAGATGMRHPGDPIEGDLFELRLMTAPGRVLQLRAIRPAARPADAYVGFTYVESETRESRLSPPVLVPGGGVLLGQCLKAIVEGGEKIAADPNFATVFSNALERAVQQRGADETAEAPAKAE